MGGFNAQIGNIPTAYGEALELLALEIEMKKVKVAEFVSTKWV